MGFNPQLGLLERPSAAMQAKAREALRQVGLEDRADENYQHLSEGQKQLCILARTLAVDARLLLLDEPESALDFQHRHRLLALLRGWAGAGRRAALVALHDPALALNGCDGLLTSLPPSKRRFEFSTARSACGAAKTAPATPSLCCSRRKDRCGR